MDYNLRHLRTLDEYDAHVALQRETWGPGFDDCVPASILQVSQKVGGITAGAFDTDGAMIGCVFGMTGYTEGRPVHWSDILAVTPRARGLRLGRALKMFQREELLKRGVETMRWTYDPLQALNANLNLNSLGARTIEYVVDMYGYSGSDLHQGLSTDRFIVQWDLAAPEVEAALKAADRSKRPREIDGPNVSAQLVDDAPEPAEGDLVDADVVYIEIPASINEAKCETPDAGARWRACTRRAFTHYLDKGYRVDRFVRDDANRFFYVLQDS